MDRLSAGVCVIWSVLLAGNLVLGRGFGAALNVDLQINSRKAGGMAAATALI